MAFASAEFRMRIEARDCPTGWSHAKSPGVGLADARVAAFSAPFVRAGEAADVVLRFDAAEAPLVTGDSVTFKLPAFTNQTAVIIHRDDPARRRLTDEQCALDGSDYDYRESIDATARYVSTSHCPNHVLGEGTTVNKLPATYALPLYPKYDPANPTDLSERAGAIGTLFNGAMLLSGYGGATPAVSYQTSAPYLYGDTFDACGCTVQEQALVEDLHPETTLPTYGCHGPPTCLLRQLDAQTYAHSPQVGWAADGFPVYGPRGEHGTLMKACGSTIDGPCLDACGGYYGPSSQDEYVYRYHTTGEAHEANTEAQCAAPNTYGSEFYPFTPACLAGCVPDELITSSCPDCASSGYVQTCSSDAIDGFTALFKPNATRFGASKKLSTDTSYCSSGTGVVLDDPSLKVKWNAPYLKLTIDEAFPTASHVLATVRGLTLPEDGIDGPHAGVTVSVNTAATGLLEETAVESVPVIAALHHSSLDLAEPFAGVATRLKLQMNFSVDVPKGSRLQLTLPAFGIDSATAESTELDYEGSTGDVHTFFTGKAVDKRTLVELSMNGTVPTEGVDGQGDHGCMLTMNDVGLDATPIQHVESAPGLVGGVSISFGSLDFGFARIERGDGLKVRFPPSTYGDADGLTNGDAGTQYRVGGALMTVASVQGDVITFAPPHDFNRVWS